MGFVSETINGLPTKREQLDQMMYVAKFLATLPEHQICLLIRTTGIKRAMIASTGPTFRLAYNSSTATLISNLVHLKLNSISLLTTKAHHIDICQIPIRLLEHHKLQ